MSEQDLARGAEPRNSNGGKCSGITSLTKPQWQPAAQSQIAERSLRALASVDNNGTSHLYSCEGRFRCGIKAGHLGYQLGRKSATHR
jgi:hypothetical protein